MSVCSLETSDRAGGLLALCCQLSSSVSCGSGALTNVNVEENFGSTPLVIEHVCQLQDRLLDTHPLSVSVWAGSDVTGL